MPSPTTAASSDAKASPFGAARPIDTAAKEKEIEEKKEAAAKEKKEAEEKAKEEKREAAKAKAAEEAAEAEKKAETAQKDGEEAGKPEETIETENANGNIVDDKAVKPREIVRDARPKPVETGAWRRASNGPPTPRDDIPRGPRGGRRKRSRRGRPWWRKKLRAKTILERKSPSITGSGIYPNYRDCCHGG